MNLISGVLVGRPQTQRVVITAEGRSTNRRVVKGALNLGNGPVEIIPERFVQIDLQQKMGAPPQIESQPDLAGGE